MWLRQDDVGSNVSSNALSVPALRELHSKAYDVLGTDNNGFDKKGPVQFPQFVQEQELMLLTTVRHPFDR